MTEPTKVEVVSLNMLMPKAIAEAEESVGIAKAALPIDKILMLGLLAGAYIGVGAHFATVVSSGLTGVVPFGIIRLLAGLVFCTGLIAVVIAGAELFTGNNLLTMAWASGRITTRAMLSNWMKVWTFNFIGALGLVALMFLGKTYIYGGGAVGTTALSIAAGKVAFDPLQALVLGILCNGAVCLALWLAMSAKDTVGKVAAIVPPVTFFVAAGFEHSVANMFFIPMGLAIKYLDPAFTAAAAVDVSGLTVWSFLYGNLLWVTLGNIIGGGLFVGLIYWVIYLRQSTSAQAVFQKAIASDISHQSK